MEETQNTEDSGVEMRYDHLYKSNNILTTIISHISR